VSLGLTSSLSQNERKNKILFSPYLDIYIVFIICVVSAGPSMIYDFIGWQDTISFAMSCGFTFLMIGNFTLLVFPRYAKIILNIFAFAKFYFKAPLLKKQYDSANHVVC